MTDERGNGWDVDGDAALLDPALYPNALERLEGAVLCATAGDVIVSATPGWEFADSGGIHHLGGGSHGSLRVEDSLVPLVTAGFAPRRGLPVAAVDHRHPAVRLPALRRAACEPTARPGDDGRIASPRWRTPAPKPRRPLCGGTRSASGSLRRSPRTGWSSSATAVVGGSGYLINLGVFLLADRSMPYTLAFTVAFICAATSNFLWNRLWTFRVEHGRPHHQYARFLGVSAAALVLDLIVLRVLVELAGAAEAAGGGHRDPRGAARELPWQQALDV